MGSTIKREIILSLGLLALLTSAFYFFVRPGDPLKELFYGKLILMNCNLVDQEKRMVRWNRDFAICKLFPDGKTLAVVQAGKDPSPGETPSVSLLDRGGRIIWKKGISAHHMLRMLKDGKRFILIVTEEKIISGRLTRSDSLYIMDLQGEILKKWSFFDHLDEIREATGVRQFSAQKIDWIYSRAKWEITHANSVQEIAPNKAAEKISAFAAGNFLVNFHAPFNRFLILDKNLDKILWISRQRYDAHDVQLLPEGRLLFLRNSDLTGREPYSALIEMDPLTEEVLWSYRASPPASFHTVLGGSVRKIGRYYLFTEMTDGAWVRIVDRDGRPIWSYEWKREDKPAIIRRAELLDLRQYLKNSNF